MGGDLSTRPVLAALGESDVEIILRGVDIQRLLRRYTFPDHPHSVALSHLIERIDECSEERHNGVDVSMIADEHHQSDIYQRELWEFQRYATGGYRSRKIVYVKVLDFADSNDHRLLQAIDLVVFLNQRRYERLGSDEREDRVNQKLWDLIKGRVIHNHCWQPQHA